METGSCYVHYHHTVSISSMPTVMIIPGNNYYFWPLSPPRTAPTCTFGIWSNLCFLPGFGSRWKVLSCVRGVVQGHKASPGYERNVLLFQQACVMLGTLTVWQTTSGGLTLVYRRLTITTQSPHQWHGVCMFKPLQSSHSLRSVCLSCLVPWAQCFRLALALTKFIQSLQLALANGKRWGSSVD